MFRYSNNDNISNDITRQAYNSKHDFSDIRKNKSLNSNDLLLSHVSDLDTSRLPSSSENIFLCVFNIKSSYETPFIEIPINAYNWQQGARAQWIKEDLFIYNSC